MMVDLFDLFWLLVIHVILIILGKFVFHSIRFIFFVVVAFFLIVFYFGVSLTDILSMTSAVVANVKDLL